MKNLLKTISAVALVAIMASCGSGSGAGKNLPTNDILGDLPNLVYQRDIADSIRDVKKEEAIRKAKLKGDFDNKKAMQIEEKFNVEEEKAKLEFIAKCEKIKKDLIGKDVPFEVEEGTGYEVVSCKIVDDVKFDPYSGLGYWYKDSYVSCEVTLKITNKKAIGTCFGSDYNMCIIYCEIDKNGKIIFYSCTNMGVPQISDLENGKTIRIIYRIFTSKEHANFGKIIFKKHPNVDLNDTSNNSVSQSEQREETLVYEEEPPAE